MVVSPKRATGVSENVIVVVSIVNDFPINPGKEVDNPKKEEERNTVVPNRN